MHKDEDPGKGFFLAYRGAADTDRAEVITQEIQSMFRLPRPNPKWSRCYLHLSYLTQGSHGLKSVLAQQFTATFGVYASLPAQRSPGASQSLTAVTGVGETEAQKN